MRKVRTGSCITNVCDNAQTLGTPIPTWQDVAEKTNRRLLTTRAELNMTTLFQEMVLCQIKWMRLLGNH